MLFSVAVTFLRTIFFTQMLEMTTTRVRCFWRPHIHRSVCGLSIYSLHKRNGQYKGILSPIILLFIQRLNVLFLISIIFFFIQLIVSKCMMLTSCIQHPWKLSYHL